MDFGSESSDLTGSESESDPYPLDSFSQAGSARIWIRDLGSTETANPARANFSKLLKGRTRNLANTEGPRDTLISVFNIRLVLS